MEDNDSEKGNGLGDILMEFVLLFDLLTHSDWCRNACLLSSVSLKAKNALE